MNLKYIYFWVGVNNSFLITFLGASSLFGRVASALIRQTPSVWKLKLYDEQNNVHPGPSSSESSCLVQWHRGKEQLTSALEGSDIIVIGDDNKLTAGNEKDLLLATASRLVDYVFAIAHTVPKAMLVVAASPLNLMVPLAGYILKELGCYDGRKLLGVTSTDTLRANALYSSYLSQTNSILPVVGGASPQTRVPIFSHAKPCLQIPEEDQHQIIELIKSFDLQVQGQDNRGSTIERAYATVRLVHSLISGLLEEPFVAEMALAKTSLIPEVTYFSLPVDLGRSGIERTFGLPQLSPLETEMIDYAVINLNNDLMKAHDLYATFKPCFEMVKTITGTHTAEYFDDAMKYSREKIDQNTDPIKKENLPKTKSYKRKRRENHCRNRKKSSYYNFPILHCPAPDVMKDNPKEEKFGRIKQVHKKLEMTETILPEKKTNQLPMLRFTETLEKIENNQSPIDSVKKTAVQIIGTDIVPISANNLENKTGILFNAKCIEIKNKDEEITQTKKPTTKEKITLERNREDAVNISPVESQILEEIEQLSVVKDKTNNDYIKRYFISTSRKERSATMSKNISTTLSINEKNTTLAKSKNITRENTQDSAVKNDSKSNVKQNISDSVKHKNKENFLFSNKNTLEQKNIMEKMNIKKSVKQTNKKIEEISHEANLNEKKECITKIEEISHEANLNEKKECITKSIMIEEGRINNRIIFTDTLEHSKKKKVDDGREKLKKDKNYETEPVLNEDNENKKTVAFVSNNDLTQRSNEIEEENDKDKSKENVHNKSLASDANNTFENSNHIKKEYSNERLEKGNKCFTEPVKDNDITIKAGQSVVSDFILEQGIKIKKALSSFNFMGNQNEIKSEEKQAVTGKVLAANVFDEEKQSKDTNHQKILLKDKKMQNLEEHKENQVLKDKVFVASNMILDGENKIPIDTEQKFKETKCSSEKDDNSSPSNINNKVVVTVQRNDSMKKMEPSEQGNKIREITTQKLKEPNQLTYSLKMEEKEISKGEEKDMVKEAEKISLKHLAENIQTFNYRPNPTKDTRNITNIDDMVHDLVKEHVSEDKTVSPPVKQETNTCKQDNVYGYDGSMDKNKVLSIMDTPDLKPKVFKENINTKTNSKVNDKKISEKETSDGNLQLNHKSYGNKKAKQVSVNINAVKKKKLKVGPLPFFYKNSKLVKEDDFHKKIWSKQQNAQPPLVTRGISPTKVNLDKVLENKRVAINSYNINESFTKQGIKTGKETIYKPCDKSPTSYTIDTKSKRDDLSRRYTILKKGQVCNMIKEDINANELKTKLYKKSAPKIPINANNKQEETSSLDVKDLLADFESKKNINMNMTDIKLEPDIINSSVLNPPDKNDLNNLSPLSSERLVNEKNDQKNFTQDAIHSNNMKQNNTNPLSLKNKSFLNLVVNRISKRAPTMSDTTETISIRGSHNAPINYDHKKPINPDERKLLGEKLIKKAKDQLFLTKLKSNRKTFNGPSGSFPFVLNETDVGSQRPTETGERNNTLTKDPTQKSMAEVKYKMQLLKDKYQYLKSRKPPTKNHVIIAADREKKEFLNTKESKDNRIESSSNKTENKRNNGKRFYVSVGDSFEKNYFESKKDSDGKKNDKCKVQKESKKDVMLSSFHKESKKVVTLSSSEKPVTKVTNILLEKVKQGTNEEPLINEKEQCSNDPKNSFCKPQGINNSHLGNEKNNFPDLNESQTYSDSSIIHTTVLNSNHKINESTIKPLQEKQKVVEEKLTPPNEIPETQQEILESIKEMTNLLKLSKINMEDSEKNTTKPPEIPARPLKPYTPKKKVFKRRAEQTQICSSANIKPNKKSQISLFDSSPTKQVNKFELSDTSPLDNISKVKRELSTYKPTNEIVNIEPEALDIFANRPTSKDFAKNKNEQKTAQVNHDYARSQNEKISFPSVNLGFRGIVENKLVPKRCSVSLLLDPNHENRTNIRKEIPPSLMHAVKPFTSLNNDLSTPKTNFYLRWSPQSKWEKSGNDKMKIKKDVFKPKEEQIQKNPFVSGKINMTSDLFREYMKKNRNNDFRNSDLNGEIPFLNNKASPLAIAPPQTVPTKTNRLKDQRVNFCTLKTNSGQERAVINGKIIKSSEPNIKQIMRTVDFINPMRSFTAPKYLINEKSSERIEMSSSNRHVGIDTKNDASLKYKTSKGQNGPHSSYKPQLPIKPPYLTLNNKSSGRSNIATTRFRRTDKEEEMKRIHLLKAFQDQEKTEQKFEELQRHFKKQKQLNSEGSLKSSKRVFRTSYEPTTADVSPKRIHMLKAFSKKCIENDPLENNRRVLRQFSAPPEYHPSFPLSKPKKFIKEKKKEDTSNSLKKRWAQLLDIFQSVITTEKKNWEQSDLKENLLLTNGSAQSTDTACSTMINANTHNNLQRKNEKRMHTYYRRHSAGISKRGSAGTVSQT